VDVTFCLVDATDDGVLDLPRPRIDAHGAGRGMTVGYATALGRLGAASEDEITAALYRSPDYGHHGPVVLDLAETFAAIELDHGLTRPNLTTALTHGDRARLRACRAAARVVIAPADHRSRPAPVDPDPGLIGADWRGADAPLTARR
jgi:hypothetical protein